MIDPTEAKHARADKMQDARDGSFPGLTMICWWLPNPYAICPKWTIGGPNCESIMDTPRVERESHARDSDRLRAHERFGSAHQRMSRL